MSAVEAQTKVEAARAAAAVRARVQCRLAVLLGPSVSVVGAPDVADAGRRV